MAGLTQREVQLAIDLVRDIHRSASPLSLSSNIMEVIMSLATRVVVFHQGKEIARGSPREVTGNPAVIAAYLGTRAAKAALATRRSSDGRTRDMTAPLLKVEHLEVRYGDLIGVSECSLDVRRAASSRCWVSNGGGKTTTLNAVAGLIPVHSDRSGFAPGDRRFKPRFRSCAKASLCRRKAGGCSCSKASKTICFLGATPLRDRARAAVLLDRVYEIFPKLGAAQPAGGHHVRRRAADAGGRPCPDERSQTADAR